MGMQMLGLGDIVRTHATQRANAVALVYQGRQTTYSQLDRAANHVAQGLIAEGAKPGSRIAHLDKSSDLYFELLFGVAKANAVMVSVNWRLAPPEVLHIVNDAEAEILFVGEEFFPVIDAIRDQLPSVRRIVSLSGSHPGWEPFAAWRDRQPDVDPHLPAKPSDTAVQIGRAHV